jgi:hypothetical protein
VKGVNVVSVMVFSLFEVEGNHKPDHPHETLVRGRL